MGSCPSCGQRVEMSNASDACPICGNNGANLQAETLVTPRFEGAETVVSPPDLEQLWQRSIGSGVLPILSLKNRPPVERTPSRITVKVKPVRDVSLGGDGRAPEDGVFNAVDFELQERIGEGGVGVVYEARQTSCDRTIAIKMLRTDLVQEAEQRASFLYEGTVTADLEHPNIVPIHDLGQDERGYPFYAMKRVQGTPWSRVIRHRTLEENLSTLMDVADAVAFAHSRGVIHRDLKPDNVMLGDYGEVLLMDWGLAVSTGEEGKAGRLAESIAIAGTPAYMAPEMACGRIRQIGPVSDVYLLGAILYEICTGTPPHSGNDVMECLRNASQNVITPTTQESELIDIALKAMATEVRDRYPSVKALQKALREYEGHAESMAFCERALELTELARNSRNYEDFNNATFTFHESIRLWSGNATAAKGLCKARMAYAETACDRGDLDLAESLLKAGGLMDTPLAERLRLLRRERACIVKEQEILRATAEKWSTAFLMSPDSVVVARESDGVVLEVNDVFQQTMGFTRDEIVGRTTEDLGIWVSAQDRESFICTLQRTGRIDNMETTLKSKSGRHFASLMSARIVELEGIQAVVSLTRDITDRKRAEDTLRRNQRRLLQTQRLAGLGTWELDLSTHALTWSAQTFRIAGMEPRADAPSLEEYLATLHPEDAPELREAIDRASKDAMPFEVEIRHRMPNGTYNHVVVHAAPVEEQGRVSEIFGSVLDITERKRMEEALRESERQCRILVTSHGITEDRQASA